MKKSTISFILAGALAGSCIMHYVTGSKFSLIQEISLCLVAVCGALYIGADELDKENNK